MLDKFAPYKGKINSAEAALGMRHAASNGARLLEDAQSLFAAGRFPSATALAILAIEEFGKIGQIRSIFISDNAAALKSSWRAFRSHTAKNVLWTASNMDWSRSEFLGNVFALSSPASAHPALGDLIKQLSFYVDLLANGQWSVPAEVIDAAMAERFIASAQYLQRVSSPECEEELDIFAGVVKRYVEHTLESAEAMQADYYQRLQEAGLRPPGHNPWIGLITRRANEP